MKLVLKSANNNKTVIFPVLMKIVNKKFDKKKIHILEIASGSGQHASHITTYWHNQELEWQPTDIVPQYLESIQSYIEENKLTKVKDPVKLDISEDPSQWKQSLRFEYELMLAINLLHISSWQCTVGLFRAAKEMLPQSGVLVTYGAYSVDGILEPESNRDFDAHLRSSNPEYGIRDVGDLEKEANKNGIRLDDIIDMPSNNKILVWVKE